MELTLTFLKLFFWSIYLVAPLLVFLSAVIIVLGQAVTHIEKWAKFDGLYWSFITATTVGYGDIRPLRKFSKGLSVIIALTGMMFTGIIIAVTINTVTIALDKHVDPSVIEQIKAAIEKQDIPIEDTHISRSLAIQSRNWHAWIDRINVEPRLQITGEIDLPTPGYTVKLVKGPLDRRHPPAQNFTLELTPPSSVEISVITPTQVQYAQKTPISRYRMIRVFYEGELLTEIPDVMLTE